MPPLKVGMSFQFLIYSYRLQMPCVSKSKHLTMNALQQQNKDKHRCELSLSTKYNGL